MMITCREPCWRGKTDASRRQRLLHYEPTVLPLAVKAGVLRVCSAKTANALGARSLEQPRDICQVNG